MPTRWCSKRREASALALGAGIRELRPPDAASGIAGGVVVEQPAGRCAERRVCVGKGNRCRGGRRWGCARRGTGRLCTRPPRGPPSREGGGQAEVFLAGVGGEGSGDDAPGVAVAAQGQHLEPSGQRYRMGTRFTPAHSPRGTQDRSRQDFRPARWEGRTAAN